MRDWRGVGSGEVSVGEESRELDGCAEAYLEMQVGIPKY